jgi:hypothetical protein
VKPFIRSLVRLYLLSLLLVGLGIGLRKLFGHDIQGPWCWWMGAVPAIIALIMSLPMLHRKFKNPN